MSDLSVCAASGCDNLIANTPNHYCDVCSGGPVCLECYGEPEQACPLCGMNEHEVCIHLTFDDPWPIPSTRGER